MSMIAARSERAPTTPREYPTSAEIERIRLNPGRATPGRRRNERELLRCYAETRCPAAREALVHSMLPLARHAARRFAHRTAAFDDLVQVASLGLLKALDRFDPDRGIAFSTFAMPTMTGELQRHLRDHGSTIRPPRSAQELAGRVGRASDEYLHAHQRTPTSSELAEMTGLDPREVDDVREAMDRCVPVSLSAPVSREDDSMELGESLAGEVDGFERVDERATIDLLAARLDDRERDILRMRIDDDLTQREIGAAVGLSQMQVSRLLTRVVAKMRAEVAGAAA